MLRISSILCGIVCALGFSQFPEFAQQYEQRLGGAVDELTTIVVDFDESATRAGLSRDEALVEYETAGAVFLADRGADMRKTIDRQQKLSDHLVTIDDANMFSRLAGMAQYFDAEISSRALQAFSPAVPTNLDGLIFLGIGFIFGAALLWGIWAAVRRVFARNRAPSDTVATTRSK